MAKKKFPYILIKDAKNGFRTQLIGGNGEPLMTSEVLESAKAVKVNLVAACRAMSLRDQQTTASDKQIGERLVNQVKDNNLDFRYTGKSDAIYKMFRIENIS